jgi:hypothetical protein
VQILRFFKNRYNLFLYFFTPKIIGFNDLNTNDFSRYNALKSVRSECIGYKIREAASEAVLKSVCAESGQLTEDISFKKKSPYRTGDF